MTKEWSTLGISLWQGGTFAHYCVDHCHLISWCIMKWQLKGDQFIQDRAIGIGVTPLIDTCIWIANYLRSHPVVSASDSALGSGVIKGSSGAKVTELSCHAVPK